MVMRRKGYVIKKMGEDGACLFRWTFCFKEHSHDLGPLCVVEIEVIG